MKPPLPAIQFEPDGYVLTGPALMGRHSAGHAFLRAAVQACDGGMLVACTPRAESARVFADLVKTMDARVQSQWLPSYQLDGLRSLGCLFLPGPGLHEAARLRLRAGPHAYSLCGVTHTLSTHLAMDAIKHMVAAPVMPWDALVCTSSVARTTVQGILAQEQDYLRWRLGASVQFTLPQLPVIPLGVHASDFQFSAQQRQEARTALGMASGDVVLLFAGRLSFNAKAHPHAMFAAVQAAALRCAQTPHSPRPTLLLCGQFANDTTEQAFRQAAAQCCPDVRVLFTNGRDDTQHRQSWAAADVFISLADNIQETFGLTPVEAMAAGLPVLVSDWNGYKDTVRDGVDGFRIPTWMPARDTPELWSAKYEAGDMNHDMFAGLACQTVALDMPLLVERLVNLIQQPQLRQRLGQAGRAHVAQSLDWAVVFKRYETLWQDLAALRAPVADAVERPGAQLGTLPTPRHDAARPSPWRAFATYASHEVCAHSLLVWRKEMPVEAVLRLLQSPLFSYSVPQEEAQLARLGDAFRALAAQPMTAQTWAMHAQAPVPDMILLACQLAKMGALHIEV